MDIPWGLIVKDILIPEIMTAIRAHKNATGGQEPTEEQVLAALPTDVARFSRIGHAFLDRTASVPAPTTVTATNVLAPKP